MIQTKQFDDYKRLARVLPDCTVMVSGEILNAYQKHYRDYDQVEIAHGGDCVTVYGREDIEALRDFLTCYLAELNERDAKGQDEIPEDAACGPVSEAEIEAVEVEISDSRTHDEGEFVGDVSTRKTKPRYGSGEMIF